MTEVPARRTNLSAPAAIQTLASAYEQVTGNAPESKVLGLLTSQTAHETADWFNMFGNNWAGLKASASYPLIQYLRTWEIINGQKVIYEPSQRHPNGRFRAYNTPVDGATDYIQLLRSRPTWWSGLHSGDTDVFNQALNESPRYYTADKEEYRRALHTKWEKFYPLSLAHLLTFTPLSQHLRPEERDSLLQDYLSDGESTPTGNDDESSTG